MIWELSNPNACKSILPLVILRFCSSSLVTKPLLTARTLSRIFSRRRVTRNCCISWSACNAKVARNCHTGWSRRSALKVVTPTEVRKEGTREDGNKVRIKGAMMWKRCATMWFLDCMTNMRKKWEKKDVDGKWRKKYLPGCKLFFRWDLWRFWVTRHHIWLDHFYTTKECR